MSEITVRKANRIIRVTENELQKYINNGYAVIYTPTQASEVVPEKVEEKQPETVVETKKRRRK